MPWATSVREEAEEVRKVSVQFTARSHCGSTFANKASYQNIPMNSSPCGLRADFHSISNFIPWVVHSIFKTAQMLEANSLFRYSQTFAPAGS